MKDENDILTMLRNIRDERKELISIRIHKEEVRLSLLPGAMDYSKDKVDFTPDDPMLRMIERLEKYETDEHELEAKIMQDIDYVNQVIKAMPTPEYRTVIRLRYIDGDRPMHWNDIAAELSRDPTDLRGRIHGMAIAEARHVDNSLHHTTK